MAPSRKINTENQKKENKNKQLFRSLYIFVVVAIAVGEEFSRQIVINKTCVWLLTAMVKWAPNDEKKSKSAPKVSAKIPYKITSEFLFQRFNHLRIKWQYIFEITNIYIVQNTAHARTNGETSEFNRCELPICA